MEVLRVRNGGEQEGGRNGESLGTSKVTIPSVCLPSCQVLKQIYFLIMDGSPRPCYLEGGEEGGDGVEDEASEDVTTLYLPF